MFWCLQFPEDSANDRNSWWQCSEGDKTRSWGGVSRCGHPSVHPDDAGNDKFIILMFPFISVFEIFENWSSVPSYYSLRKLAVLDFAPVLWSCFDLICSHVLLFALSPLIFFAVNCIQCYSGVKYLDLLADSTLPCFTRSGSNLKLRCINWSDNHLFCSFVL